MIAFPRLPMTLAAVLWGLTAILPVNAQTLDQDIQHGLSQTADAFIVPNFEAFASESLQLARTAQDYCQQQTGASFIAQEQVQNHFAATFLAWQRASLVQIGPVLGADGPLRFQLWPDPKGFSRRAIQRALENEDPMLLHPGSLATQSIALSNLMALELLLYQPMAPRTYGCDLAVAISLHQATMAQTVLDAWMAGSDFRQSFDTAIEGNDRFSDVNALLREVLAGAVVYTDRLRKFKLLRGLGDTRDQARLVRTEAYISNLGLASVRESYETLADFLTVKDGIFERAMAHGSLAEHRILNRTNMAVSMQLTQMPHAMETILEVYGQDAEDLRRFAEIAVLNEAYFKVRFPQSIGLISGFTSADGD